eukprot:TRINITY_DN865_c0_g1_i2.p1 TRINITY_DN865_c0_g1~~TRINITY_DN865_c0_g1_i2.p1  ORF type:complete len:159 (+),score=34.37 TRINITY_DN865_c0_g1_i2:125-601(+)
MPQIDVVEVEVSVPPIRLWKTVVDLPKLAPKIMPDLFLSIETLCGDGGVGTVRELKLRDPFTGATRINREVIDVVDEKSHTLKYHVEEGDVKKHYSVYNLTVTIVPAGADSAKSKVHYSTEYEAAGDVTEYNAEHRKGFTALAKALEAHLHANSSEYA